MSKIVHLLFESIRLWARRSMNVLKLLLVRRLAYVWIDLDGSLPEFAPRIPFLRRLLARNALAGRPGLSLEELESLQRRITADPRTEGVIVRIRNLEASWAAVEAARRTLLRLREKNCKLIVLADTVDTPVAYLMSAADRLILNPAGQWGATGLQLETLFLREALAAVGIEAEVLRVSPYKAAADPLVRDAMSEEHQEMLDWLLDGIFDTVVAALAESRNLDPDKIKALIDAAPMSADAARDAGLVDEVAYPDTLVDELGSEKKPAAVVHRRLAQRQLIRPTRRRSYQAVAVVPIQGVIVPGPSRRLPLPVNPPIVGRNFAGSETVIQALRLAEQSRRVGAVVLYVDSRGGSALASDQIWREVYCLSEKKPVVVLMGSTAASGGYYVGAGASFIFGRNLTLTGSIGVVMMKPILKGLAKRLKLHRAELSRGRHAGLYRTSEPFRDSERAAVAAQLDDTYDRFLTRVETGRGLERDALAEVAGGRVWLGEQARGHGLIDEIGDMSDAVAKAKELAGIAANCETPVIFADPGPAALAPPERSADTDEATLRSLFEHLQSWNRSGPWALASTDFVVR